MTCDAHVRARTRDDVCEHVCEASSQSVKKLLTGTRKNEHTYGQIPIYPARV